MIGGCKLHSGWIAENNPETFIIPDIQNKIKLLQILNLQKE